MSVKTVAVREVLDVDGVVEQAQLVGSFPGAEAGQLLDDDRNDLLGRVEVDAAGHGGLLGHEGEHVVDCVRRLWWCWCVMDVGV